MLGNALFFLWAQSTRCRILSNLFRYSASRSPPWPAGFTFGVVLLVYTMHVLLAFCSQLIRLIISPASQIHRVRFQQLFNRKNIFLWSIQLRRCIHCVIVKQETSLLQPLMWELWTVSWQFISEPRLDAKADSQEDEGKPCQAGKGREKETGEKVDLPLHSLPNFLICSACVWIDRTGLSGMSRATARCGVCLAADGTISQPSWSKWCFAPLTALLCRTISTALGVCVRSSVDGL